MFWEKKKQTRASYVEIKAKDITALESKVKSKHTLLMLHMNGCWHCEKFKPTYDSFAKAMKKSHPEVQVMAIEADVLQKLSVKDPKLFSMITTAKDSTDVYFPKLIAFKTSKTRVSKKEFESDRTEEALVKFVKSFFKLTSSSPVSGNVSKASLNEQIHIGPYKQQYQTLEKLLHKYTGL